MSEQLNLFDDLSFYEGPDVEYKAAKGGLPGDLWETYSAFANTQGGVIWLGVSQKTGRLDIHGLTSPEKVVQDFWNTVNNRSKVSANLLANGDVTILPVADHAPVVRIHVPRADRKQRPVFLGSDPFRGTFRRNNEGDYRCSEAEVRRMFADQSEEPADSRILAGFGFDDLHPDSIRQFRNRFGSRTPHPWLAEDDRGLLEKLGGWRRDRATKQEGVTLAGLLMFGREQAIRDPAAVPGFHLDYREHYSDDPAIRWTDRLTLDGTWEGNLFQFYQQVLLKLSTGPGIRKPFQTDAEGYRLMETPVIQALQEALVNALIHTDYAGQGGIVIDRWVDRLEFSNPGTLLVSRDQLLRGGVSECRNKSLQLMFQMLGAGDKAGSGIDKIRSSWTAEHWQSPSLKETVRPDRVLLVLPLVSMLPEEALNELRERFGDMFDTLDPEQRLTLVTTALEGEITNQRLQELLSLHRTDITALLRSLVSKGMLVAHGIGRGTSYAIPVQKPGDGTPQEVIPHVGSDSQHVGTDAPHVGTHALPVGKVGGLTAEESSTVERVVSGQAPRETTRQAILILCRNDFLTARELGALLNRNPDGLRDRFLAEMVNSGLMETRYPDARNRRDQGYRTRRVTQEASQ
jgi:ATP-dependent DNA helicase RecG